MSVAATNYVWEQSPAEGADRLVLLALADFADESGNCFGSWGTMQRKTLLSRRTIARSLSRLVASGELVMIEKGHRKLAGDGAEATVWQIPGVVRTRQVSERHLSGVRMAPKWCQDGTQVVSERHPNIKKHKEPNEHKAADAPAPATASPSLPIPAPVNGSPQPRTPKPKFDATAISLPHGNALSAAWAEFAQHRREIKAPLTPTAAKRICDDLAAVNEVAAVEALRKSVKHGWRGVFVDKPADSPKVAILPRTGPVQPSEAERRMLELEARMKGAA